jgi:hypothetical protein
MAHLLEQKIGRVRRQARWLLALYALGWTASALLAAVLLLATADYLIRFQDPGIRVICSLSVLLVFAWACHRYGTVAFGRSLGDVQIAQRVERYFPALANRLASSIEFLKQTESDVGAGSADLRRAVIVSTATDVEPLDFSRAFERGPTRRAVAVAGALGLVSLLIAMVSPDSARTAVLRLARPLGSESWPRYYNLAFRQAPTRLAAGQAFEVELLNDAEHRVPDNVRIHYRYETAPATTEDDSESMNLLAGVMTARKENVSRPFWYRAEGGDDHSMPWIRLEVVEPPRIESLELALHPPEYTGLAAGPSDKNIHALRGTHVQFAGAATKKLRSARLCQEGAAELPMQLSADAYGFSLAHDAAAPLTIDKSGPYWILLEDQEGLLGGADEHWDIYAIADQVPTVTIEQPSGNVFVTPQGRVPLKIAAKDDLALRDIALHFSRSGSADVEDASVPLYQGPPSVAQSARAEGVPADRSGESRVFDHLWSLGELGLKPGAQVTFWATAGDYLPQTGKSTVRRIAVITPAELEERLAQRQTLIFGELERVLKLQQDARAQTRSLEIQLDQVGRFNKQDVDHAQSAELNQRQVARTLTSESEGIPAQIADFLTDLENNRVDSPDIERHMTSILAELDRLDREHLGPVERELTSLIKAAQAKLAADTAEPAERSNPVQSAPKAKPDPAISQSLSTAGENQQQVIGSLENMLRELGQWESYRRFAREIAQLHRDQEQIAAATKELGQKTLGKELKDLDPQQQADLKKLSSQQTELSRRLERVQQQMAETSQSLKQTDPLSAATIADGVHQAQQQAISGQMRQASGRLERNQLGQAVEQQAKITKDLDDLMGILSNRREQELTRLVKQLRESERQLNRIRAAEAGLRKQARDGGEEPEGQRKTKLERLAREQKQLQEETARLARRLERLQADGAGQSGARAADRMRQAGEAGDQGDAAAAEQQAEHAEKDLEEAQQRLAERRRQAEEDLAREQMARLEDSLKSLHERQRKLIDETRRLEDLRSAAGRFSRAQLGTLHDLSRQQQSLEGETAELAEKLALAEVINLALEGAAKQMTRAAELLARRDTGSSTQTSQETARARLAQLLAAMEDKDKPAGKQGEQQEGGQGGGKGSRADGNQVLTQLKLLKLLQEDLNGRYRSLAPVADEDGAAKARELAEIAGEQGKLADLVLKLAEPPADNPEDDPEKLPDVRQAVPDDPSGSRVPAPEDPPETTRKDGP